MRIFDPMLALGKKHDIWSAIDEHTTRIFCGEARLEDLNLEQFGIRLCADDFDFERCRKWTKREPRMYRREVVVLSGLRRSINVRLTNKQHFIQRRG